MLPQVDWNSPREMGRNPPFFPVGTQWETRGKNRQQGLGKKGFPQKKVLSLVLCVAMLLSVMVMGTGAAFTDQDEIQNAEAVDMTSALGIIDGYEDGSFQPAENIERGEAAKMISAMLNGGRDSVQETTESSYNDVLGSVDAWANKYIEYCTARGIVSGVGGDRFAPASNVTGTQLAKMLLVSLGYDSVKEGYQDNAMWSVNVNTDAVAAGLYAGIETIDMSAPLSRDDAAQMIWNALQAKTVVYLTDSTGAINIQDTTLLDKVYGAGTVTGIMTAIDYNVDTEEYTYTVDGKDYTSTADYSALFAQTVKVLAKDDEAMMIRTDKGGVVVEATIGDIDTDSLINDNHFNSINVNGTTYRLDNTAKDWDNFWTIACGYNQYGEQGFWGIPGAGARHTAYAQYTFAGIDQDGGGDIDVIVVYPYVVLKTTNVMSDSFRTNIIDRDDARMTVDSAAQSSYLLASLGLKGNTSNDVEYTDVIVNGTVARDGYVMAVPSQYTATGVDTYTVLDIQSGVANKLNSDDRMVTLGDTEYNGNLLDKVVPISSISLGDTYSYVEVNDYLFIVDGNNVGPVLDEYAVVTKVAATPSGVDNVWATELLFTDNTTQTVNVKGSQPTVGSLYTYRVLSNDYYELIAVPAGTNAPAEGTNFDVQQAYKTGATLNNDVRWTGTPGHIEYTATYVENPADGYNLTITLNEEIEGFVYYDVALNNNGTVGDIRDDYYSAVPTGTDSGDIEVGMDGVKTPAGTYYYKVDAEWVYGTLSVVPVNVGISGMYVNDDPSYFHNFTGREAGDAEYYIEDNAVVFVYNTNLDSYEVVTGADLENIDQDEIQWAFTGGNEKNGNIWVDLAYVSVENDPNETLVYGYVSGNPDRVLNADGKYVLTVDVILANGEEVTLTSKAYDRENDSDLMRLYNALYNGGIYQLIVEDTTLVDIKDYHPAETYTVTSEVYNSMIGLDGTNYLVTEDTIFIPVSGEAESIDQIQKGETVRAVIDGSDLLAVIY